MDARGRRVESLRGLGALALILGFLIAALCIFADSTSIKGLFVAGLLMVLGVGLRLEAAIVEGR